MKKRLAIISTLLIVITIIVSGVLFLSEKTAVFNKKSVTTHTGKMITCANITVDIQDDIKFISERIEIREEQERIRLEKERMEQEKERLRLEEEKRKEEERLRLEEEKRKEEERLRLEVEKRKQTEIATQESSKKENKQKSEEKTSEQPKQPEKGTPTYSGIVAYEREVVKYTNIERVKNGLPELKIDNETSKVAWYKSKDMQTVGYFDHTSPTYGSPFDMMSDFGIYYTAAGENIAYGYPTAKSVVDGWMNSPSHRANILNDMFTHIGVGYVQDGHYATQMFLRK
nr:CAP domain-containing protein [Paenibacillus bovis]